MRQGTILVVEDDPMMRMDAALLFEEAGFETVEFECADEALAYVWERADQVTAIFTDVQMLGDADGVELASVVAASWPHIAVLVTSGYFQEPPDHLPSSARFLPKPWLPGQVLSHVQQAIQRH